MKNKYYNIALKGNTKMRLDKFKIHNRESYDDLINRIIDSMLKSLEKGYEL
jgi:hypothetical protein